MESKEEPKQPTFRNWEPLKKINNPTFDLDEIQILLKLIKQLEKENPNDMEFGKIVRKLLNSKVL